MGHPMRLELTRVGLLVKLANQYTTKGVYQYRSGWTLGKTEEIWLLVKL